MPALPPRDRNTVGVGGSFGIGERSSAVGVDLRVRGVADVAGPVVDDDDPGHAADDADSDGGQPKPETSRERAHSCSCLLLPLRSASNGDAVPIKCRRSQATGTPGQGQPARIAHEAGYGGGVPGYDVL